MSDQSRETVLVGRIVRVHGLRGDLVVEPLSDVDERFDGGAKLLIGGTSRALEVDRAKPFGDRLLVHFVGVDDRDLAEALRGSELRVPGDQVPAAPDGEYYFFQLVGCLCIDRNEGELGRVTGIIEDGGGLLFDVRGEGRDLLVPFVKAYLIEVDIEGQRIVVDLPEGLVEICASTS